MNILRVKRTCIDIIERVEREGAFVHIMLQREAERRSDAPQEYPIVVQLVRGVLEQRQVLEAVLNQLLPKGLESLPLRVQIVLRLGAYQICFLDKVKERDVVFEAVELIKGSRWSGFAGLVNAILRRVDHESAARVTAADPKVANFPAWLTERWEKQFGAAEVRLFYGASDQKLPLYLRINTRKTDSQSLCNTLLQEGIEAEPVSVSPDSLRIIRMPAHVRIQQLASFLSGLFFIQDLSSTLVGDLISSGSPKSVRDLCAAPGGKACSIALSIADSKGVVYASDRTASRVSLVSDMVRRVELDNVAVAVVDALAPRETSIVWSSGGRGEQQSEIDPRIAKPPALYDAVLLDAPCSGFGTVGRKVDIRWSKSEQLLQELVTLQAQLLDNAATLVRPGGVLVYSTCTIDRAENEETVASFLSRHPKFSVSPATEVLPAELCTSEGFYRVWPQRHQMAGAFAARLMLRQ
jgi:16S rRNA (cytosine967-C5)-methyltransferase